MSHTSMAPFDVVHSLTGHGGSDSIGAVDLADADDDIGRLAHE